MIQEVADQAALGAHLAISEWNAFRVIVIVVGPQGEFQVRATSRNGQTEIGPNEAIGLLMRAAMAYCGKFSGEPAAASATASTDENGQP